MFKLQQCSLPFNGLGQKLSDFISSDHRVLNRAKSGRSSKSFYEELGLWKSVLDRLESGDILLIQFGHNDAASDENRHTDPFGSYQEYLTNYIEEVREKEGIPVLVTPINKNKWVDSEMIDAHQSYVDAMKELALSLNVLLIDAQLITSLYFEGLGQEYVTNSIFMNLPEGEYLNYPYGNEDNTHFQDNGAKVIAGLIYNELEKIMKDINSLQK